ncbi:MFS transporter [Sphingomonas sp. LY29]|uniref:MFS transporter n=1 Tax=Sphingomonas sp. LY29 TaxID=3095341 RepID=UPI002D78C463|nr:MFS transporter [Sphingomonas sp. LY29]WRP24757.1 MFS transporter [Sphingomonas sp. LY29]
MALGSPRVRVAGSALASRHFMLLYAAMLVAAAGNTALQSVMPAIGREIGLSDLWVTLSYTWSAVLWVALAPYWARKSDTHGRKALTLLGVGGFIASMLLCGLVLLAGLRGLMAGGITFALFALCRSLYGSLGCATPSATQAYLASRTRRSARVTALSSLSSSFGLGTIVGPALAPLFVLPFLGLSGPLFAFAAVGLIVFAAIAVGLPDDKKPRHGRRAGQGAAMSYPSLASSPTGASVIAATAPKVPLLKWHDSRIRNWIVAGVMAGHAQAATPSCIGFFVIDRLALAPRGAEQSIAIVMMAGAAATLAAQWGLIPKLGLPPRSMILWGAAVAAAGSLITMMATGLYAIVLGFGIASLGFGFTRPGFTGGASLAVPLHQQGGVAGVVTAANGIAYVAAPGIGMALYALDPHFPFAVSAALLLVLIVWGRSRLAVPTPIAD